MTDPIEKLKEQIAKLEAALKMTEKAAEESRRLAAQHWEALQMLKSRPLTEALLTLYSRNVELVDSEKRARELLKSTEAQCEHFRQSRDTMMREAERRSAEVASLQKQIARLCE